MSLIELMMALALLTMAIMTGLSMEFGVRRLLSSTDLEARVMSELSPIVMRMTRDINRAIGRNQASLQAYELNTISGCSPSISLRVDSNGDGLPETTDLVTGYGYNAASHEMRYYANVSTGTYEVMSDKITSFTVSVTGGVVNFGLTARANVSAAANLSNPEVTISSSGQVFGAALS